MTQIAQVVTQLSPDIKFKIVYLVAHEQKQKYPEGSSTQSTLFTAFLSAKAILFTPGLHLQLHRDNFHPYIYHLQVSSFQN